MYYRHTPTTRPMSDWGHAMMSEREDNTFVRYPYHWVYDGAEAVRIEDLYTAISEAWDGEDEDQRLANLGGDAELANLTAAQVCDALNPEDIVDSARGYDNDLTCWLWANVLEPMGIMAVITNDGAVVFDEALLTPYSMEDVA